MPSTHPVIYRALEKTFAKKKSAPMAPPNSGPRVRLIMKYAPPPSTAPLVEMAQTERMVEACRRENWHYFI